jgi:hypothetical protein
LLSNSTCTATSRTKLSRGDAEMTGLDVMYMTDEPAGGCVGVAVWPLPLEARALDPQGLEGVRQAVEGIPLAPGGKWTGAGGDSSLVE